MKSRNTLPYYVVAIALLAMAACASLGVPTPASFNEKESAALSTATGILQTTTTLLQADKITAADAQNILKQTDNLKEAVTVADAIHTADPTAGGDRLTSIITSLNAISAYLATRGH